MLTKNLTPEPDRLPLLTFSLGNQRYALEIADVVEVAAMIELTVVPDASPEILGIANRRGTLIPILDLRRVFKQPDTQVSTSTLFIVAVSQEQHLGLVVDEVQQVEYVNVLRIQNTPTTGKYIRGMISHKEHLIQIIALSPLIEVFVTRKPAQEDVVEG